MDKDLKVFLLMLSFIMINLIYSLSYIEYNTSNNDIVLTKEKKNSYSSSYQVIEDGAKAIIKNIHHLNKQIKE